MNLYKRELEVIMGQSNPSSVHHSRPYYSESKESDSSEAQVIHAPLTEREIISAHAIGSLDFFHLGNSVSLNTIFPGRTIQDVDRIITNVRNKVDCSKALLIQGPSHQYAAIPPYGRRRQLANSNNTLTTRTYHEVTVCKASSGAITKIAINDSKCWDGVMALCGACAVDQTVYNRPGELISLKYSSDCSSGGGITCSIINGHYINSLRCTVNDVIYSSRWSVYATAGNDGRVVIWNGSSCEGSACEEINSFGPEVMQKGGRGRRKVYCTSISPHSPLLAYGLYRGTVIVRRINDHDQLDQLQEYRFDLCEMNLPRSASPYCNNIDNISFSPIDSSLVASVGFHQKNNCGNLFLIDPIKQYSSCIFSEGYNCGISCFDQFNQSSQLICGSGLVTDECKGSSHFTLIDPRMKPNRILSRNLSPNQSEMEQVMISSNDLHLAITDNNQSVTIWDMRRLSTPLHSYSHAVSHSEADPTFMMGLAWSRDHGDNLFTGGADGMVKITNINTLSSSDLSINIPISAISLSTDDSILLVGTDMGSIHSYSLNPSLRYLTTQSYKYF